MDITRHAVAQQLIQDIKTNSRIIAGMQGDHSRGARLVCADLRTDIAAMEAQLLNMISEG